MAESRENVDRNLQSVIDLCFEMLELADHGDKYRRDDGCGVVFGEMRDAAYKIRQLAVDELAKHKKQKRV